MSDNANTLAVWEANQPVDFSSTSTPNEIVAEAKALSERDVRSITKAFQSESYEMVSTFIWTRAITGLKKQIASLGMEFVGQMLGRPDIRDDSDPATSIGEHDAISLAEDLGMITTTEALRLKHSLELVGHFADSEIAATEQMNREEAVGILRSCVASILGSLHIAPPIQFAELKVALESESLSGNDPRVAHIAQSPYFIQRTILSVLMSLLKTAESAQLEHAIGNTNIIVPRIWANLRKPEKWQVGQVFAEVHASGKRAAAVGLKQALTTVQGFDFVPETLRSESFARAAHRVKEAHFAVNNFYKEAAPIAELASLGTTIPKPAFRVCMTALLCVKLGNCYGHTWDAQDSADQLLQNLRPEQWKYYFNECFVSDKTIQGKLTDDKPASRWIAMVQDFDLNSLDVTDVMTKRLLGIDNLRRLQEHAGQLRIRQI
ncbi:MAG: hypothetical protein O7D91_08120 [Planctomycetota bacterium]|nr:hypothetical protein [Planctomycetota bacterium]